jgi:hypothetical protein
VRVIDKGGRNILTADNDREWNTIANGMRVAAERFKEHAAEIRNINTDDHGDVKNESIERLAKQFDRQEKEALEIAEYIEAHPT